ncbi:MAG TPA: hypothetical protein VKR58_10640 [Aquella sp.]|nr:hypothetical protein [Aquella sp.]
MIEEPEALIKNDYPLHFLIKHINVAKTKFLTPCHVVNNKTNSHYVTLPYIKDFTDKATKDFKQYNIKVALIPGEKLKTSLKSISDSNKQPKNECGNVVYHIPCSDCERCYVGQTRHPLSVRIKEHANSVKNGKLENATAAHTINEGHKFDFANASVIDHSNRYNHLIYLEATHIVANNVVNGNTAWRSTNLMWLPFLRSQHNSTFTAGRGSIKPND